MIAAKLDGVCHWILQAGGKCLIKVIRIAIRRGLASCHNLRVRRLYRLGFTCVMLLSLIDTLDGQNYAAIKLKCSRSHVMDYLADGALVA